SMRVVNMARDEKIDKILESVSCIETMISQLSLNNNFETPTKLSSQKKRPFSNRLKAKSSDIDIHTAISDDEDDLIELDKSEELVVTDTVRAIRSDFHHFIPDRPITDK
ncbi:hypothetical protein S245_036824, partial [Arachis hypogaea]